LLLNDKELVIVPTKKNIAFSNALDCNKYLNIYNYFFGCIYISAGIAINLTNDMWFKPANIALKLSKCRINKNNQKWRKSIIFLMI